MQKKYSFFLFVLTLFYFSRLLVSAQTPEKYEWRNVAIGGGGFVSGIITSKTAQNLVYARIDVQLEID